MEILLILILISLLFNLYLVFQLLPEKKKLDVKRKIIQDKMMVDEWIPPEADEEIAFKTALKNTKQ